MSETKNRVVGRLADLIQEMDCVQEVGEELVRRGAICDGWGGREDRYTLRAELRGVLQDVLGQEDLSHRCGNLQWLTMKQAAEKVGVRPKTVRDWVKKGHLRAHGPAGALRVRADELAAFMECKSKGTGKVLSIKSRAREILERTSRRDD